MCIRDSVVGFSCTKSAATSSVCGGGSWDLNSETTGPIWILIQRTPINHPIGRGYRPTPCPAWSPLRYRNGRPQRPHGPGPCTLHAGCLMTDTRPCEGADADPSHYRSAQCDMWTCLNMCTRSNPITRKGSNSVDRGATEEGTVRCELSSSSTN